MGDRFREVYHRINNQLLIYDKDAERSRPVPLKGLELDSPEVIEELGEELAETLKMEIELLDGAGDQLNIESYLNGELAPVFFGSALNNFGVEPLLDALVDMAPHPLKRVAQEKEVDPYEKNSQDLFLRFKPTWILHTVIELLT